MDEKFYLNIKEQIENGLKNPQQNPVLSQQECLRILDIHDLDTFELLQTAYYFRKKYFGKVVVTHILNNVQNGHCTEDCKYCAQSISSKARIEEYAMKKDEEILKEAKAAYQNGAHRYCMVFSGPGPSDERIKHLCELVRHIKSLYPIEVCVSPGVISLQQAQALKQAGLDRLNHNLNTAPTHYPDICTTHTFEDRLKTIRIAKQVQLAVCSGLIVGMGETPEELISLAMEFSRLHIESIPVNFLIPIEGIALKTSQKLSPEYCLRVLCLFRFLNPLAEIRMAAGREIHLRSLEPLGLYAANSLFLQGYLNAKGGVDVRTLAMIKDMGFTIESDIPLDDLIYLNETPSFEMKKEKDLRPFK